MVVTFVRIDDRMIHGQTVTRWAKEKPCDGLIAVNDAAASNKVLIQAYKGASDKKTFVWTKEAFSHSSEPAHHSGPAAGVLGLAADPPGQPPDE